MQLPSRAQSHYDPFAPVYNEWLAEDFCRRALPVIQQLVLATLPPAANLLDLCCGTGQLARSLSQLGYAVTGIDASPEMLRIAKQNAPAAKFVLADARTFRLSQTYAAAISTFNSLAHIVTTHDLIRVFNCVRATLRPGAPFLFDLSMEEAYTSKWRGSFARVTDYLACIVRPSYDATSQFGTNRITVFEKSDHNQWERRDFTISQKCHRTDDIRSALREAGYDDVEIYDAERDLGMNGDSGRSFFLCR